MKATAVAAAAALLAGGVNAHNGHRHAHQMFQKRGYNETEGETCVPGCTTVYTTVKGTPELYFPPPPPSTSAPAPVPTTTPPAVVPTPIPQICPTPGTYTFPASTIVVTETTTVCGASTTEVPYGTHTLGGVTTVVETATTITCPYATTKTENGVVTSVLETTTYVCPSAGTYTIAPITTTVTKDIVTVVVPVVTTYCPGTYTAPAVTTVVETATVVYCPFTSETPVPAYPTETPVYVPAPPAYVPAPPPPKPTKPAAPATGYPSLGGKGDLWAMTYTPFADDGTCKSKSQVATDVAAIAKAGFTTLRVYSTDCDTLPNVGPAARAHGLSLIVGIFIGAPGCTNGNPDVGTQIGALKAWKQWDMVEMVIVGNEAMFNGFCSPGQLRDLILHVKSELGSTGYKGPYTTTDVVSAWESNDVSGICSVIDVVACNSHAYFNPGTLPSQAGEFVKSQLSIVEKICGKKGYVAETGWPTRGECFGGVTCPGKQEQYEAINSIKKVMGKEVVFFSFTNDPWKKPGACNCEKDWGCREVFNV